ncbi:MAG TPA: DMT family transporter [Vicinamibacterales bacterium]|nr:DMT family transporter [Vicinamibacterales bacterium]
MRLAFVVAATMLCFSANSLLTRGAIGAGRIDWMPFMAIRLVSGAVTLAVLARMWDRRSAGARNWRPAVALGAYAMSFTWAYTRIGATAGALLLFGAVQVTMIGAGLVRGERPARVDWLGIALAIAGLLVLTLPTASAPDPVGSLLMLAAGVCWGVYSLAGRDSDDPIAATSDSFLIATPICLAAVAWWLPAAHITWSGAWLAVASGSVASGLGYSLWYTVLPEIAAWRAAIIQLTVPVLTGLLAELLLDESLSTRLFVATLLIAAGVVCTVLPAWHRASANR